MEIYLFIYVYFGACLQGRDPAPYAIFFDNPFPSSL